MPWARTKNFAVRAPANLLNGDANRDCLYHFAVILGRQHALSFMMAFYKRRRLRNRIMQPDSCRSSCRCHTIGAHRCLNKIRPFRSAIAHYMHRPAPETNASPEFSGAKAETAVFLTVSENDEGQRLDNFLVRVCKGVPKSHLYRIVRSGELRVNKGRVDAQYRLQAGDVVRIPPMRVSAGQNAGEAPVRAPAIDLPVLYEDEGMLIVNKPSGVAVHGGSGVTHGVIERLRSTRQGMPGNAGLELVHRLDRDTSGALVIAKKRSYLRVLQEQIRNRLWIKRYSCLVSGVWPESLKKVDLSLVKTDGPNGEKKVYVNPEGQPATTLFRIEGTWEHPILGACSLLDARLITGRTHQIRVHTSAKGHCILGDERYGHFSQNKQWQQTLKLNRMFLHARHLELPHPVTGETLRVEAPLPDILSAVLLQLNPHAR